MTRPPSATVIRFNRDRGEPIIDKEANDGT
jgi:hypothetical protein